VATLSSAGVKLCDVMSSSEPPPLPRWTSAEESALELCRRTADEEQRGALLFSATGEEVDRRASILFAFAQDALRWTNQNDGGARSVLLQVRCLQDLAFDVVTARSGSRRRAKQLQLEASGDDPLTVCVGDFGAMRLPDLRITLDPRGELEDYRIPTIDWNTAGTGCGAICADSTGLQRPTRPRKWCSKCRKASSSRTSARITKIVQAWGPRQCDVCGTPFTPTRSDRWRCDRCLAGHRRSAGRKRHIAQPSS
jgi:hypothetical protein